MVRISVYEVSPKFAVEPDLGDVALTEDAHVVPLFPIDEGFALLGERGLSARVGGVGLQPFATGFVVDAAGPGAFGFVAVFALVTEDPPVVAGTLEGAEHHARVAMETFVGEPEIEIGGISFQPNAV